MRWVLSLRDWRSHAVNETVEHHAGGLVQALCGHLFLVMASAAPREEPFGTPGGLCVALRLASLHARHLAAAFGELDSLHRLASQTRGLADEASGLPAEALRDRLRTLADLLDGTTADLDRELTHLTNATIARHDQLPAHGHSLTPPLPQDGGHPDDRQPKG